MLLTLILVFARATGALFIFSGVQKIVSRYAFETTLRSLPFLPPWSATFVVSVLPWLEITLGSALVTGFLTSYAVRVLLALLLVFTLTAVVAVMRGVNVPCSCFGAASQAPLSWRTMVRNLFIALLLLPLVFADRPLPMSVDAMLRSSVNRSIVDAMLLASFPICVAGIAILVAVAQTTLAQLSTR